VPLHAVRIRSGMSSTVETEDGRSLVDMTGGLGTLILGYAHPRVTEAIRSQAGTLVHASYPTMPFAGYEAIASWLAERFTGSAAGPFASALFNSGAEAVENAMKIAGWVTGRPSFITLRAGFHGRSVGASALTYRAVPYRAGLSFAMPRVVHLANPEFEQGVPPGQNEPQKDPAILADAILSEIEGAGVTASAIAAIVVEPIQGEGGIRKLTASYWSALRLLARRSGALLISDEIQSGCGRTGTWFPSWIAGEEPDIVVSGKALGGGLPLSAISAPEAMLRGLMRGALGGTMGGNPLACAAGLATVAEIKEADLMANAGRIEARFRAAFATLAGQRVGDSDIRLRAHGAMLAIEFSERPGASPGSAGALVQSALRGTLQRGALALRGGESGGTLRMLPALTITEDELDRGLLAARAAIADLAP